MEKAIDRAAEVSRTQVKKLRWAIGLHGLASVVLGATSSKRRSAGTTSSMPIHTTRSSVSG